VPLLVEANEVREIAAKSVITGREKNNFAICTLQFFRQGRIPLGGTFYNVVFTKSPKAIW